MEKPLNLVGYLILGFAIACGGLAGCKTSDTQEIHPADQPVKSREHSDPGPDGNYATYDQNPDNPPKSPLMTYINADGREVQNPTAYNEIPPGASAICNNGEYSFSKRRCGTCSGNGGVKKWLRDLPKC